MDSSDAIYGTTSGSTLVVEGLITGQGSSSSNNYTANVTDFYYTGTTFTGTVSATYVAGSSIQGTISESGNGSFTFSGTAIPSSSFTYNQAAQLSAISGTWTGTLLDGSTATVTINSNGSFSGIDSGCSFSGTMTPDSSGKNFFDVTLTYGASCQLANQTQSGAAVDYLLSDGVTRQLVAAVSSGTTYGTVFIANN